MDINTLRSVMTIIGLAAFAAIVWWAYLPSRKGLQDEEARRILENDGGEGRA